MHADFVSQAYFRNPVAEIEKLRSAGPVVEVQFPMIGKVWTTTTQDLADRVLKDSETFTIRTGTGAVTGLQWWMPVNGPRNLPTLGRAIFPSWRGRRSAVCVIRTSGFWRPPPTLDRRGRRLSHGI